MEEQFVPYELALKLKELGFYEKCFKVYDELGFIQDEKEMDELNLIKLKAPLWQQAFEWLLWKLKHISISIDHSCAGYELIVEKEKITDYHTKEECLIKLIELVETKKDSV